MSMNQHTLDGMPHLQLVKLARPSREPKKMIELTVDGNPLASRTVQTTRVCATSR